MKRMPMAHFEGKYTINTDGTIISHRTNDVIRATKNPNGYYKYTFSLNGKRVQQSIHQTVAKHFLPNPYGHTQVNHINGNKQDNHIANLEWVSASENIQHSLRTGLRKGYMSLDDKQKYLTRVLAGELIRDIANEIGRREETLSKMLRQTALSIGKQNEWKSEMQTRRKRTAKQNLQAYNASRN